MTTASSRVSADRRLSHHLTRVLGTSLLLLSSTASAVDLIDIYEESRRFDATFQGAARDFESAELNLPIAKSSLRPQLTLSGSASLTDFNSDASDTFLETGIQLQLSQTLFDRQTSALIEQAEISVTQAEAQFAAVEQDLVLRVTTAYFDVLRAEANVEFSQSELQAIRRQREQAERRFDVGLVAITDVRTAQAAFDLAIAQEIAASNALEDAREALRVISGVDATEVAQLAADFPLLKPDPDDVEAWVDVARASNLPLVIARLASDSARAEIASQRGQRYPTVALTATAIAADSEQRLRSGRSESGVLGLQATVPIFTSGRIRAQIAQAQADWLSSTANLDAQERAAVQQARDGFRGVNAAIARANALNQALVSTQQSADAVEAGFRAGTRTSVEVLNAQRDLFQARADFANARYDYILSSFQLKAAAGRLRDSDLATINRFLIEK